LICIELPILIIIFNKSTLYQNRKTQTYITITINSRKSNGGGNLVQIKRSYGLKEKLTSLN
jgi:hypothetical protein